MKLTHIRILNFVVAAVFIGANMVVGEFPTEDFYQDVAIICLLAGVIDVYLQGLNDN